MSAHINKPSADKVEIRKSLLAYMPSHLLAHICAVKMYTHAHRHAKRKFRNLEYTLTDL